MALQKGANYYDISMTDETNRYLFRILAFKEILKDPSVYGFYLDKEDLYNQVETAQVEVTSNVPSWGDFAQQYGISYRTLKVLNPWIVGTSLNNSTHRAYLVKILRKS